MECEFCSKMFSTKSVLKTHKKTAKYCLEIQGKKYIDYECKYCKKSFSVKHRLQSHYDICILNCDKLRENINNLSNEIEKLKSENIKIEKEKKKFENLCIEKDLEIKNKNETIRKIEDENNIFKGKISVLNKNMECVHEIAKQPKITNSSNRILNIQSSTDFSNIDALKNIIEEKYDTSYLLDGQRGAAKFAFDHYLKDTEGNIKYICTDPSRSIFKYKLPSGDIKKDIEAKRLTNFLIDGGLQDKSKSMFTKLWTTEDGEVDGIKCSEMLGTAESIFSLRVNNLEFKKELAHMTTV